MEEDRFYIRVIGIISMVLISLIASCTYSNHDKRDKWEKAVSNGADPMVASCALFAQDTIEQASCLIMAQNRK